MAEPIRYALAQRDGLRLFLNKGRVEADSNIVERSIPTVLSVYGNSSPT